MRVFNPHPGGQHTTIATTKGDHCGGLMTMRQIEGGRRRRKEEEEEEKGGQNSAPP